MRTWQIPLFFALLIPGAGQAATKPCVIGGNFVREAYVQNEGHYGLTVQGCMMTLAFYHGQGRKWAVDLCADEVKFHSYRVMDDAQPKLIRAGSDYCPKPLFGADLEISEGEGREEFAQERDKVFSALEKVRRQVIQRSIQQAQAVSCAEELLRKYLERCELQKKN